MLSSFWKTFLKSVEDKKKNNPIYHSILHDAKPIEIQDDTIILACGSIGAKNYLQKKKPELEEKLSFIAGRKTKVELILKEKTVSEEDEPLLNFQPSKEDAYRRSGLNVNFTFDNYAVSPTNQVAFAAAQSVAQSPGVSYNPLFFYGGVGVGKTHLAQAIAREILERDTDKRAFFCSGEKFMNELIEGIRTKTTAKFRKKYRTLNLIIVDDVQFIAGKQHVQEEFFHTFNSIVSAGGQVVLTSDRPPYEIKNLEDRLRSRFSGGLLVDIQQPNFELRTAILLIKAREKNIEIEIEAAKIIAEKIRDTRSLEGTLLSLYARTINSEVNKIDLMVVEELFKTRTKKRKKRVSPQDVIKSVCSFYNLKQSHLKGKSRKSEIALARQVAMYLLRTELDMKLEEVAAMVKRKDHTTVLHAVDKIRNMNMKDAGFQEELDMITKSLRSST